MYFGNLTFFPKNTCKLVTNENILYNIQVSIFPIRAQKKQVGLAPLLVQKKVIHNRMLRIFPSYFYAVVHVYGFEMTVHKFNYR